MKLISRIAVVLLLHLNYGLCDTIVLPSLPCHKYGTLCDQPGNDGTCDPTDPDMCKCTEGYVRSYEGGGVCTEGTHCEDGVRCDEWRVHMWFGVCTRDNPRWCKCTTGHRNNPKTGECIQGTDCDGFLCDGIAHDGSGLCAGDDDKKCRCAEGYIHNTDGHCVDKCDLLTCTDGAANSDTCIPLKGCECREGRVNNADGVCEDVCKSLNCYAEEFDGTCISFEGCKCKQGYIKVNGKCVRSENCGKVVCTAGDDNHGSCDGGYVDGCYCKQGYANVADGSCAEVSTCGGIKCDNFRAHDRYGVCTDDGKWCKCARRYFNHRETGECVEGTVCDEGVTCDDSTHMHDGSGVCITGNSGLCRCVDGYAHNSDGDCEPGSKCDDGIECTDWQKHEGNEVCLLHNSSWCKCNRYNVNNHVTGVCESNYK